MPLIEPDIQIELAVDDEGENIFLEDITGLYSSDNTEGYNLPGGMTVNSVTSVTITLNYTQHGVSVIYALTIASGVITAATSAFAGASAVNILSELESTAWPFTSNNQFNLTGDYGVTLPTLSDMAFTCEYQVEGTYLANAFDYTAEDKLLVDNATCCCVTNALVNANMSDINPNEMSPAMTAEGWLMTANAALNNGDVDKANDYLVRAKALCDSINECNC